MLVDQNEQKLASEVQDLRDAVAYLPHRVTVRAGDFADLGACDVIVNSVGKIDLLRGTALITGFTAKESVVSTLTVLLGGDTGALNMLFTPFTALVFLIFTLLYTPCVAAIAAVKRELGGGRAALGVVLMQCAIAWVVAFAVHCVGVLLGLA